MRCKMRYKVAGLGGGGCGCDAADSRLFIPFKRPLNHWGKVNIKNTEYRR